MKRFAHSRAEEVYQTGFAQGVPEHVSRKAHWKLNLLIAAHELRDIGAFGQIARWTAEPDRYGIHIDGKWFVTFRWVRDFGAAEIRFERRK